MCFYTLAINSPKKLKNTISYIIASKIIKYLRINLTEVKVLQIENYKTLLKELKDLI